MTDDPAELWVAPEPVATKKRRVMREHQLQARGVVPWATKAALDVTHKFVAFDSAGKRTDEQRVFEAARGVSKGTPDTVLFLPGRMPVWIELKWGNVRPDDDQLRVHRELVALGHYVGVANSVEAMFREWHRAGVPMRPGACVAAQQYDAKVAAVLARLDGSDGHKKSKPRSVGPRHQATVAWGRRQAAKGIRV